MRNETIFVFGISAWRRYEAKDNCIGAREGTGIMSKQAHVPCRLRLRLLILENFFFYTPMLVGRLSSLVYTTQSNFFALEFTHDYEAYHISYG